MDLRFSLKNLARPALRRAAYVFLLALANQFASAATYYVATNGSDGNGGSQSAPFRHLSKGAAVARAGDTVIVMDGTYDNEGVAAPNFVVTLYYSGTPGSPITFKAQNRGKAILDSMNTSTTTACNGAASYLNLRNASFIVIQGFVIQRGCDSGIQSNDSAHDILIKQNEIRNIANHTTIDQIGRDGIYLNTSEYNFTFDSNVFHDIGRTGGTSMLHFDHGIYSHAQNVRIINNIFYNMNRGWAIQLADGASNYSIANNTFAFGNANGESGQLMFWGDNSNIALRNNIFYLPNGYAMTRYAATITGCVFDHNIVYPVSGVMATPTGCSVTSNQTGSGADPKFVNASAAPFDFHLQPGAPGIDAGVTVPGISADFDGASRPQGSSLDQGAYEYAAVTAAPVVSGLFASALSTSSVVISWSSDQPSTSAVQFGLGSYTNASPTDSSLVTIHSVTLTGLAAGTTYHFRVGSQNSTGQLTLSSDSTVTTLAPPPPFTFSLTATDPTSSLVQGLSSSANVTATLLTGIAVPVTFSATGLPAGATADFSSASCTAPCSSSVKVTASPTTAAGVYNVVVAASGSGFSASTNVALTVVPAPPPAPAADITSGLAAQWRFNEGSGAYAADSSGHSNTATLYNPTWWQSDYGTTAWFKGADSFGAVAESPSLQMTNQLTVAFWLRPSANPNTDPRIIGKIYDWEVKLNGSNRYPQLSAAGQYAVLNYPLPLITWHHVVFTFSTGVVKGYVDGVEVPFLANTFTGTETLAQWAYGLRIASDASSTNSYIGSLDDVRLYNRLLSSADVRALYTALPKN